jgi:hypothetical protein
MTDALLVVERSCRGLRGKRIEGSQGFKQDLLKLYSCKKRKNEIKLIDGFNKNLDDLYKLDNLK